MLSSQSALSGSKKEQDQFSPASYLQQEDDDQFLRSLLGAGTNDNDSNNINSNNNIISSDISISASSNNGDSNSTGLSPPSASNHSISDPESPHDFRDFIFNSHNSGFYSDKFDASSNGATAAGDGGDFNSQFGNGNMMIGMANGIIPMDPFQTDSSNDGNSNGMNPMSMGLNSQGMSPFIFANGVLEPTNDSSTTRNGLNSNSNAASTSPNSSTFNPSNSVDPSMMSSSSNGSNSGMNSSNSNGFVNRYGNQNPLPPTHIQNQMQQLSPHTSTANYQAQLQSFLQQQAQQFSQQHHQQALIQAQALAYAQSQYVATIQNQHLQQQQRQLQQQQHQQHQQQQLQRNVTQMNHNHHDHNSLGSSPSSISGSSVYSPESNQVDRHSSRNQSLSSSGASGLAVPPAPAVQRRASARDLSSQSQPSTQSQPQQSNAAAGSKTKANNRKRKGSDEGQQNAQENQPTFMIGMPRMEVGSNATARAAIQRLRAKQQAESQQGSNGGQSSTITSQQPSIPSSRSNVEQQDSTDAASSSNIDKQPRSQKKVAHNAIERRYRNNINDRISALRSAVPALCELRAKPKGKGKGKKSADDLVDGVAAATKLNKGVILGKATEYIHHLKKRETTLSAEVTGLRELVKSLEGGEELLDLWQAEWEKLETEKEREEKENQPESYDGEEDEEDEDEDEDERPHKLQRLNSSGSPTSTSSGSSGRYMMAAFMGISLFGGAAEFATDSHSPSTSTMVPAPSSIHAAGGRVIGAGHQLLKRANVPMVDQTSIHHFDHVPTHALAFEILRAFSILAMILFIFWPMISKFFHLSSTSTSSKDQSKLSSNAQRRQTMLSVLSRRHPSPSPSELDQALRTFVRAPESRLSAILGLVVEAGRYALRRAPFGKIIEREEMSSFQREEATVWLRLLEIESVLRDEAQASDLIRAHTIVKVANMRLPSKPADSTRNPLTPARINATIAVALARSENRNEKILKRRSSVDDVVKPSSSSSPSLNGNQTWTMDAAQEFWSRAQKSMMAEEEEMEEAREESRSRSLNSGVENPLNATGINNGWLSSVLRLGIDEALTLCPAQSDVSYSFQEAALIAEQDLKSSSNGGPTSSGLNHSLSLRALDTSPLQAIADAKHQRELAGVWAKIFGNLVRSTCPMSNHNSQEANNISSNNNNKLNGGGRGGKRRKNPLSDFIESSTNLSKSFNMHIVTDLSSRAALTTQISRLAATAPPSTPSSSLSRTTLAAWALLVGNVPVARSLAAKLALRSTDGEDPVIQTCAAANALVQFVLGNPGSSDGGVFGSTVNPPPPMPFDDVDALASAAIQWLSFLRQFNSRIQFSKGLLEASKAQAQAQVQVNGDESESSSKDNSTSSSSSFDLTFSTRAEAQADQQLVNSALNLRKLLAKAEPVTISLALRSMASSASSFSSANSFYTSSSWNGHRRFSTNPFENESSDSSSSEDSTSNSSKSSITTKSERLLLNENQHHKNPSSTSEAVVVGGGAGGARGGETKSERQQRRIMTRRAERIKRQALEIELDLENSRDSLTDILTLLGSKATRSIKSTTTTTMMAPQSNGSRTNPNANSSWLRKFLESKLNQNPHDVGAEEDDDSEDDSGVGEVF